MDGAGMIPAEAVEAAHEQLEAMGSYVPRKYMEAALEAAAPHMLADYRAKIELEYTKADERRHAFRAFHEQRPTP